MSLFNFFHAPKTYEEDIDVEVNYLIHDEVFKKKPEAYIGIYS